MTASTTTTTTATGEAVDVFTERIFREAKETLKDEPELASLLHLTVLAPWVETFEDAVTATVCYRMLLNPHNGAVTATECNNNSMGMDMFCPYALRGIFQKAFANEDDLEMGHTMKEAVRKDAMAVIDRDPACASLLEVVLFYKGFAALVVHRAARQKWYLSATNIPPGYNDNDNDDNDDGPVIIKSTTSRKRSMTALFLQSQASAVFAMDIHPAATIGAGILFDHGTGIVIGETAHLGDGCTLLHGVTLGGTGKETGDRHPKIGKHVLIGAGSSILGNIHVGNRAKIGAGSIVLRPIPAGATAVGAPAKIIGRSLEEDPASTMDEDLKHVGHFHQSGSVTTMSTAPESISSSSNNSQHNNHNNNNNNNSGGDFSSNASNASSSSSDDNNNEHCCCPYRGYVQFLTKVAKHPLPPDSIDYSILSKYLEDNGCCNHDEILATFFALDSRCVGYVYRKDLNPQCLTKTLIETTTLDANQVSAVIQALKVV
eukprot:scaffold4529_cov121-Cylindrotheca_fusiformis.AAC.1